MQTQNEGIEAGGLNPGRGSTIDPYSLIWVS